MSVDAGFIPLISANSKVCPFNTHITPLVAFSACPSLVKNILYWVLSGITTESNSDALDKLASNKLCTFELIVPNSTSPILAVPAMFLIRQDLRILNHLQILGLYLRLYILYLLLLQLLQSYYLMFLII